MGIATHNVFERVAASFGLLASVENHFETVLDVTNGGVLFALPALLLCGLLRHTKDCFSLPKGYYSIEQIFILLAFMALARVKNVEQLRYQAPGEWGKLIGLDRCPHAKTLRQKITHIAKREQVSCWQEKLSADWFNQTKEPSMALYVDGHVRVYHGHQTRLPRHYVSRERLCLRATTDYWVNAGDGQPYFVINKAVDSGLLQVLEDDIVPRLNKEITTSGPHQPRFTLVFDREGYSPDFMKRMLLQNIACLTYHKNPGKDWPESEFHETQVTLQHGQVTTMKLAVRGTCLNNRLWVKEIRKLTEGHKQVSIITTHYSFCTEKLAATMFARWCQENFFGYMMENYGLDSLASYQVENVLDTTMLINPAYRALNTEIRKQCSLLTKKQARFAEMMLHQDIEPKHVTAFEIKKASLQEEIKTLEAELTQLKLQRKKTNKHITFAKLPEKQKFQQLGTKHKYFIDTIKMIAYRAESAVVATLREFMPISKNDEARSLFRAIMKASIDILPDYENKTLTIALHHLSNAAHNQMIQKLCGELNDTKTIFPATDLSMIFKLGSD